MQIENEINARTEWREIITPRGAITRSLGTAFYWRDRTEEMIVERAAAVGEIIVIELSKCSRALFYECESMWIAPETGEDFFSERRNGSVENRFPGELPGYYIELAGRWDRGLVQME